LRPGSNIKTKRFEFTPETTVCNVLVAQVGRKTVPNIWPGDSEAPVAECVVCAWNGTRSVGGRAYPPSMTFGDQMYVVGEVRRCVARQRREDRTC